MHRRPKAVVFDIDGTLYRQSSLRRAMLLRLLGAHTWHPLAAWQTFLALYTYRRAQEQLRGGADGDAAAAQLTLACERSGLDKATVAACIERWMEREPLAIMRRYLQPGLVEFLDTCQAHDIRLATLSDYPGDDKLDVLGIAHYFEIRLCAQAPEIGVFKPNPKGLRVALDRLGVTPAEALYVGDRVDVDAAAAEAAGVPCAILTRKKPPTGTSSRHLPVATYFELRDLIFTKRLDSPT